MYISKDTYKGLNELLGMTFQQNAHADNCAYWLDDNAFVQATAIFHEAYAHQFPQWADGISDLMIKMGSRPTRIGLSTEDKNYTTFVEMFEDLESKLVAYRKKIYEVIDIAEEYNDREIVNFLDDYLIEISLYLKQVGIWSKKANQYKDKPEKFDAHFEKFLIIK